MKEKPLVYVASRASIPARPKMWRAFRDIVGWRISSTWIDEAGEGETLDFTSLWHRIENEIRISDGLILYAENEDFPLKGAFVEVGMAIGMQKPVAVVLTSDIILEERSMKPLGSWVKHGNCKILSSLHEAHNWIEDNCTSNEAIIRG